MKHNILLFLLLLFLISGCVNHVQNQKTENRSNISKNSCLNVVCSDSVKICPDGYEARCSNVCMNGMCTVCIPNCSGHLIPDLCRNVKCNDSVKICPDGYEARCSNVCDPKTGECSLCIPNCSSHLVQCEEKWVCTDWSVCVNNKQTRECFDENRCGTTKNKPEETRYCESEPNIPNHVLISEVYYDAPGRYEKAEWVELFNPTKETIDISGYTISDNVGEWTIPPNSIILAGGYFTLIKDEDAFKAVFGCTFEGGYASGMTLRLNNNGDYLLLKNPDGKEIDFVAWEGGPSNTYPEWIVKADENKSIKRNPINIDTNTPNDWIGNQIPYVQYCYG